MNRLYIVTGAAGHLGNTIIRMLKERKVAVRGLILPSETVTPGENVTYFQGDVRDGASMEPLFAGCEEQETIVIHTAGIVDISGSVSPALYNVNVNGTRNIVELCLRHKVKRLVYVSSVHAIPEKDQDHVLSEVREFSAEAVHGGYAKTKAEATQAVLDATKRGLDAVVVHPSGIIGPYDDVGNHLVQMVSDYISGKLPACVRGGYDFVDVRDVAAVPDGGGPRGKRGVLYPLKPPLRGARNPANGEKGIRRTPSADAADVDGAGCRAARERVCEAEKAPSALHEIFTLHAAKQRQIFA